MLTSSLCLGWYAVALFLHRVHDGCHRAAHLHYLSLHFSCFSHRTDTDVPKQVVSQKVQTVKSAPIACQFTGWIGAWWTRATWFAWKPALGHGGFVKKKWEKNFRGFHHPLCIGAKWRNFGWQPGKWSLLEANAELPQLPLVRGRTHGREQQEEMHASERQWWRLE